MQPSKGMSIVWSIPRPFFPRLRAEAKCQMDSWFLVEGLENESESENENENEMDQRMISRPSNEKNQINK